MDFAQLDARTQHVRRLILESTCREPWSAGSKEVFGDAPLALMTPKAHFSAAIKRHSGEELDIKPWLPLILATAISIAILAAFYSPLRPF
jgi:hypothetical protein